MEVADSRVMLGIFHEGRIYGVTLAANMKQTFALCVCPYFDAKPAASLISHTQTEFQFSLCAPFISAFFLIEKNKKELFSSSWICFRTKFYLSTANGGQLLLNLIVSCLAWDLFII